MKTFDFNSFLKDVPIKPGIYQMFDEADKILYVGKAKNLKNRLTSYATPQNQGIKTQVLVSKIRFIKFIITQSEIDALILEQSLIKELKPPFNILLRDDKSYPYIHLSDDKFPLLSFYRGNKKEKGEYFGPYPSAIVVKDTLQILQKVFLVRNCSNVNFNNRSKPCLQYQINRCKAPCVNLVSYEEYKADIKLAKLFLTGKTASIQEKLVVKMQDLADKLEFEKAAIIRNQLNTLATIQNSQQVEEKNLNLDVFAIVEKYQKFCIHNLQIRNGKIVFTQNILPNNQLLDSKEEVLQAVLEQFYLSKREINLPQQILLNLEFDNEALINAIYQLHQFSIKFVKVNKQNQKFLDLSEQNAQNQLNLISKEKDLILNRLTLLEQALNMQKINRLECFDISHTFGEKTIASCVVFDRNGANKKEYRFYHINDIKASDDYAAMQQALEKRFSNKKKILPDVLIIDGGKGQFAVAKAILEKYQLNITLLGVAKGITRKSGNETIYLNEIENELELENTNEGLHLIWQIRDEAHRFAITNHRKLRDKSRKTSILENIPGVGAKRRVQLLNHFGGLEKLKQAQILQIQEVKGISKDLAINIYHYFHNEFEY